MGLLGHDPERAGVRLNEFVESITEHYRVPANAKHLDAFDLSQLNASDRGNGGSLTRRFRMGRVIAERFAPTITFASAWHAAYQTAPHPLRPSN